MTGVIVYDENRDLRTFIRAESEVTAVKCHLPIRTKNCYFT